MRGTLVDSNVLLDIFEDDADWYDWSKLAILDAGVSGPLYVNEIIWSEVSIGFLRIEELEEALKALGVESITIPKEALFLAGKAFLLYRRNTGLKTSPLPDFFIGAHAAVHRLTLLTRDPARIRTYFPTVKLVAPE
jgi:hypothetical protein